MAKRFVYRSLSEKPFVELVAVEFQYFNGFSLAQKQRCIDSLHASFLDMQPDARILEVSSKGRNPLGNNLSAFNLMTDSPKGRISVECAFQGSKVFEHGGPYVDLLEIDSRTAKKDARLRESGSLIGFKFDGVDYPTEPKDLFYCWLYANAAVQNIELLEQAREFDAFTDIEFNPARQVNCQAKALAIAVGLLRAGMLERALEGLEAYRTLAFGNSNG